MAIKIEPKVDKQFGQLGRLPQCAIAIEGCVGLAAPGEANVAENPFNEDVVIVGAYVDIKTPSGEAGTTYDIGLADDKDALNNGVEIATALTPANVACVKEALAPRAVTGTTRVIWKAPNAAHNAADSWIATEQKVSGNASALVFNIILICVPKAAFD